MILIDYNKHFSEVNLFKKELLNEMLLIDHWTYQKGQLFNCKTNRMFKGGVEKQK